MNWICCQIGAREHYAVARALHRIGTLELLLTDVWCSPGNPLGIASGKFRERFHTELAASNVSASNLRALGFELQAKFARLHGWSRMIARNMWFQKDVALRLSIIDPPETSRVLFAYSYAARQLFQIARERGWQTVLGQIDAGPVEEGIVRRLHAENHDLYGHFEGPPPKYWKDWLEECALADRVVVNSLWSKAAVENEGVPSSKIRVVPLAYEEATTSSKVSRVYPDKFTPLRPLRVLFLGSIILRKGIGPLFDAIGLMRGAPVQFWFVGKPQVSIPTQLRSNSSVRWIGPVARSETVKYYQHADVFIFPTFSDGFGLTQLEAQASALPVIASQNCGNVVEHGRNGLLLKEVSASEIAAAVEYVMANPPVLAEMSANAAGHIANHSIDCVAHKLKNIFSASNRSVKAQTGSDRGCGESC
jgi:glycosyltransferase involved in cell wall biosynthesis